MDDAFTAWVFVMSFALVGPGLLILLLAWVRGYLFADEEARNLPVRVRESDYWQETWRGGERR